MTRRKLPHSEKRKRRRPPPVKGQAVVPAKRGKNREAAPHLDLDLADELVLSMDDELPMWMDQQGVHAMMPGIPDAATFQRLTQLYQQNIRNSPLWNQMVSEFGIEKAEQLLKEFRVQPG